jgi:hypothetical protein
MAKSPTSNNNTRVADRSLMVARFSRRASAYGYLRRRTIVQDRVLSTQISGNVTGSRQTPIAFSIGYVNLSTHLRSASVELLCAILSGLILNIVMFFT